MFRVVSQGVKIGRDENPRVLHLSVQNPYAYYKESELIS